MKLSEILKDWPKEWKPIKTLSNGDPRCEGFNSALTFCDREIDREALAKIIRIKGREWEKFNDPITPLPEYLAQEIISTMPTWLKRSYK